MLYLTIPAGETFNEDKEEFYYVEACTLRLEHSLVSISKWEARWKKPFLSTVLTKNEMIDYIKCMNLTQNVNPIVYFFITDQNIETVKEYMDDSMTATWFKEDNHKKGGSQVITSEIIYYWMIIHNIPMECQKWHLNRLLTLIRVCNEKNAPKKKMSRSEIMSRNRALNAARRAKTGSKG